MDTAVSLYDASWFNKQHGGSAQSASIVVPAALGLIPNVRSVVDVGCGAGAWLAQFKQCGVTTVKGYDAGDVKLDQLYIPPECFQRADLTNPPAPSQRYDLALCLEVGEHLPDGAAPTLIRFLTSLSDVVMFSAALPGQGGTGHVNEQPLSYWRKLFQACSYEVHDVLRPKLWHDGRVHYWYRQNIVLAIRRDAPQALGLPLVGDDDLIDFVHPELLAQARRGEKKHREKRLNGRLKQLSRALGLSRPR